MFNEILKLGAELSKENQQKINGGMCEPLQACYIGYSWSYTFCSCVPDNR